METGGWNYGKSHHRKAAEARRRAERLACPPVYPVLFSRLPVDHLGVACALRGIAVTLHKPPE